MAEVLSSRPRAVLALGALLAVCLMFLIGSQSKARADTPQAFCAGVNLAKWGKCEGFKRVMHRAYGWGDSHGVCVSYSVDPGADPFPWSIACTPYQNTGVYTPYCCEEGIFLALTPHIGNNSPYNNTVHGIAFIP